MAVDAWWSKAHWIPSSVRRTSTPASRPVNTWSRTSATKAISRSSTRHRRGADPRACAAAKRPGQAPDIKIVSIQNGKQERDQALTVTENMAPGAQLTLKGIFSVNDNGSLGALSAIEASGLDVKLVSVDGAPEAIKAIQKPGSKSIATRPIPPRSAGAYNECHPDLLPWLRAAAPWPRRFGSIRTGAFVLGYRLLDGHCDHHRALHRPLDQSLPGPSSRLTASTCRTVA